MGENPSSEIKPISLQISHTVADFTEAVRIYQRTTSMHFINRFVSIAGLLVVGWGLFLMALDVAVLSNIFGGKYRLALFDTDYRYIRWIMVALVPLSLLSWFRPFRPFAVWLDFQRNKENYQKPYAVIIDHAAIAVKTTDTEARQLWTAFEKALESERLFVLVYGPWQYAVLPKREFASQETIEEFKGYLREHIATYKMVSGSW
jgi:hypothetical protein